VADGNAEILSKRRIPVVIHFTWPSRKPTLCFSSDFPTNKPLLFSVGWFGVGILTTLGGKRFYKDGQALIIGRRVFALARTCDINDRSSPNRDIMLLMSMMAQRSK